MSTIRSYFPSGRAAGCLLVALVWVSSAPHVRAAEHVVTINELRYEPAKVEIKAGDTVVWKNKDERDHTVTADKKAPDAFKSGKVASGDTYKRKFTKAGSYAYSCDYHPRMKGTVVVKE
jgi:plastocyanin